MGPGLGGKVFDKRSDQKSRIDKGGKERDFTTGEQALLQNFRHGLMAPLQRKPALSTIKLSSEINYGSATLIKYFKLTIRASR